MEPNAMTLNDYFTIVKRRKWSLILPAVFVFLCAAIVALALPSIYKSTSTILIDRNCQPLQPLSGAEKQVGYRGNRGKDA